MRLSSLSVLISAAAHLGAAIPAAPEDDATQSMTVFDHHNVPQLLELTPDNFEQETKAATWMFVKHFSPYCPHCTKFAPTWQTFYEFYYTSTPAGAGSEDADFTGFYDFRFAVLNCVAYYDLCTRNGIKTYPTEILYRNGEEVEKITGSADMTALSRVVEEALEKTKPGTRPLELALPEPGAAESPEQPAKASVLDSWAAPSRVVKQPTATPNTLGQSVSLTAESFQELVTMTHDPWFIKLFAPWCHHCQAMASNWQQLAKEMTGKLNIGEVNCEVDSRLCKDVGVHGYPTILFFKSGERVEYDGLRGLGDFVSYAEKAIDVSAGVLDVDAQSLAAMQEKEEVIFVYFYDHATTSEDFMALERLLLSLIGHARLVKTRDPALYERYKITTWPRLLVSREGRPTYYNPLTPNEMRSTELVLNWMKSVWLPIVPELTASNAREIMDGKLVVLGILNREDQDSFLSATREMKSAANEYMDKQIQLFQLERQELRDAKQLRIEEAEDRGDQRALRAAKTIRISMDKANQKEVAFAWVDGIFWQRWVRTTYGIDVKDGERVIINDEDNRRYWDQTITGNYIIPSRTSMIETISKVVASPPKIKPKSTVGSLEKIFFDVRVAFAEHPYLSLGCVVGVLVGAAMWYRSRARRSRVGFLRLDDSLKMMDTKGPILGGNTNGKVD